MKPTRAPEDITQFQHWVYSFLLRRMTSRLTSRAEADPAYAFFLETAEELSKVPAVSPQSEAGQLSRNRWAEELNTSNLSVD